MTGPRLGFTNFLGQGCPLRTSFCVLPTPDLKAFTTRPASYWHVSAMMRSILLSTGMSANEALGFTPHSWRHLYPTLARQLQMPAALLEDIGHWRTGSSMPRAYDAEACVSELAAKTSVMTAVGRGWTPVPSGCVPLPAPPTETTHVESSTESGTATKKSKTKGEKVDEIWKKEVVINTTSNAHHLYGGRRRTLCNRWACGTPEEPAAHAVFSFNVGELNAEVLCDYCRKTVLPQLRGLRQRAPSHPLPRPRLRLRHLNVPA